MLFSPVEIEETVNMFMRHKLDERYYRHYRTDGYADEHRDSDNGIKRG